MADWIAAPLPSSVTTLDHPPAWTLPPVSLIPASQFTYDDLVVAYNQTRVDYIVPMPMNAARLREYAENYDVSLPHSAVAMDGDQLLGLSMLGVRRERTWITRLGVLPVERRRGTGRALMEDHLEQSRQLGAKTVWLEVIKDNTPAHTLFRRLGFEETRELLVLRRPPMSATGDAPPYTLTELECPQLLCLLDQRQDDPNWLNQTETLYNVGDLEGLRVVLPDGSWGWLIYQHTLYQLSRLVIQPEAGDPVAVTRALLHALHTRYPRHDTKHENLPAQDFRWPLLQEWGYLVSFRRIEMLLQLYI